MGKREKRGKTASDKQAHGETDTERTTARGSKTGLRRAARTGKFVSQRTTAGAKATGRWVSGGSKKADRSTTTHGETEKIHGKPVSDEQIQAWADEAEAGYDVSTLRRRGRPTAGEGPGIVVPVRLDAPTLAALTKRAEEEGLANRSEAIRAAVRSWAHVA